MNQIIHKLSEPFPHLIVENMYNDEELELIWEELKFLIYSHKLLDANDQGTAEDGDGNIFSSTKSMILDKCYSNRNISNILTVNRKLFEHGYAELYSQIAPHCMAINYQNADLTKIRYYQNGDEYDTHFDSYNFTAITYFYKKPKLFKGGELYFADYNNYQFECEDNSMILFQSYIKHGVNKIVMDEDSLFTGNGRYAMSQFLKIL
jgi:Rps23 Pro-64 3,4-dihydroxylase Tpa1-like proline 4-hydroxylase